VIIGGSGRVALDPAWYRASAGFIRLDIKAYFAKHMQIELLKRYRAGDTDKNVVTGVHLMINGVAAGFASG
jgi:phosphoenolpyruvate carboxylase